MNVDVILPEIVLTMKFRLSTMLLVVALLLVSVGWLTERMSYSVKPSNTLDDAGAVSSTISTAFFTNLIYSELDTRTEEENAKRRTSLLHSNILHLFVNLDDARYTRTEGETSLGRYSVTRDERAISIAHAGKSLALLGLLDVDDYESSYFELYGVDAFYDGVIDVNKKTLTERFRQFIQEAIDDHRSSVLAAEAAG